jgi:type II secretory pathway predicted ATPase ExeA
MTSLCGDFKVAYIPNLNLDPQALLMAIAEELGIEINPMRGHQSQLNLAFLEFYRPNKRVLVCIDEAQAMPLQTMEALRQVGKSLRLSPSLLHITNLPAAGSVKEKPAAPSQS